MGLAVRKRSNSNEYIHAQHIVDLYLDVIFSIDTDAGWHGDNLIGKLVTFKGYIPSGSGFSGFSKVYEETLFLIEWSVQHKEAVRLLNSMTVIEREALLIDRCYRGKTKMYVDPLVPDSRLEMRWTDDKIALALSIPAGTFKRRVHDAYQKLIKAAGLTTEP